jgi:hypothetical protein
MAHGLVLASEPGGDLCRVEPEEMAPLDVRDASLGHEAANVADGDAEVCRDVGDGSLDR